MLSCHIPWLNASSFCDQVCCWVEWMLSGTAVPWDVVKDDRDWPVNCSKEASNHVALLLIWRLNAGEEAVFIVLSVHCCWIVCVMLCVSVELRMATRISVTSTLIVHSSANRRL